VPGDLWIFASAPWTGKHRRAPIGVESLGSLNLFAGQIALSLFLAGWFALQRGMDRAFASPVQVVGT